MGYGKNKYSDGTRLKVSQTYKRSYHSGPGSLNGLKDLHTLQTVLQCIGAGTVDNMVESTAKIYYICCPALVPKSRQTLLNCISFVISNNI